MFNRLVQFLNYTPPKNLYKNKKICSCSGHTYLSPQRTLRRIYKIKNYLENVPVKPVAKEYSKITYKTGNNAVTIN